MMTIMIARRATRIAILGTMIPLLSSGCKDLTAKLPAGAVDPSFYQTAEAAERMARNTRYEFQVELMNFMQNSGGVADELRGPHYGDAVGVWEPAVPVAIDSRQVPETGIPEVSQGKWAETFGGYGGLQRVRSVALQARSALAAYAPETPAALRGEMFAYEGYAEVFLADLFCSGIPLTTVDFEGDYTYRPGSSTEEVYEHAVTLFDSALASSTLDVQIERLARIGKGRALLALGRYTEANAVVADVPTGFQFMLTVMRTGTKSANNPTGLNWTSEWASNLNRPTLVSDREGGTGLPYASANDPRTALLRRAGTDSVNRNGIPNWLPVARTQLKVADHIEARLIQAEAALQAGNPSWLAILNMLRTTSTTCTVKTTPSCASTTPAGTGSVAGLPLLTDPALDPLPTGKTAADVRVDLLFRERAFWLFLTGHRQGDLRRMVRHYHRPADTVYPTGEYGGGYGYYGDYIDLPLPSNERYNPYFTGCQARGA